MDDSYKPLDPRLDVSTFASRSGYPSPIETRPSAPPIYMTTAFDMEGVDGFDAVCAGETKGFFYTRDGNPNHESFGRDVAFLEGFPHGVAAASGMGALVAALFGILKTGDHIVAARELYGRTVQFLETLKTQFGFGVTYVPVGDLAAVKAALRPETRLALVETVSNPLVDVCDLAGWKEALGAVPLVVDNTFATPCLVKPREFGSEIVWHSASKYLNGHGDVMLGVVVCEPNFYLAIKNAASLFGANANPLGCWMASRGLRTLPLRMDRISRTAEDLAGRLAVHPQVTKVFYPGLKTHSSYEIARRIMPRGFGGMLSFEIDGGRERVNKIFLRLNDAIPFSPTLADARTTVSYPAGVSHKFVPEADRLKSGITDGVIRLSVGLESAEDLYRELDAALRL